MPDKPSRPPRTVMIRIFVKDERVQFEPVAPGVIQAMQQKDEEFSSLLQRDQAEAKANTEKRQKGETLAAGQRVHADDYVRELEYAHVGVHLSFQGQDQVMWFSDQPINFAVDIQRDPELILLVEDTPPGRPVKSEKNVGIDNPFETQFPLFSNQGAPVLSGVFASRQGTPDPRPGVLEQEYYKYTVRVDGIATPLDPHIAGH